MSKSGGIDAGASCQDPTDIRNPFAKAKKGTRRVSKTRCVPFFVFGKLRWDKEQGRRFCPKDSPRWCRNNRPVCLKQLPVRLSVPIHSQSRLFGECADIRQSRAVINRGLPVNLEYAVSLESPLFQYALREKPLLIFKGFSLKMEDKEG